MGTVVIAGLVSYSEPVIGLTRQVHPSLNAVVHLYVKYVRRAAVRTIPDATPITGGFSRSLPFRLTVYRAASGGVEDGNFYV